MGFPHLLKVDPGGTASLSCYFIAQDVPCSSFLLICAHLQTRVVDLFPPDIGMVEAAAVSSVSVSSCPGWFLVHSKVL
jgi:hypothetical protein